MEKGRGKELRDLMLQWVDVGNDTVAKMDVDDKKFLKEKIEEFNRKNSKRLAVLVAEEIGEFLNLPNPLNFCQTWKFDGFFGIDFVAEQTINKLK